MSLYLARWTGVLAVGLLCLTALFVHPQPSLVLETHITPRDALQTLQLRFSADARWLMAYSRIEQSVRVWHAHGDGAALVERDRLVLPDAMQVDLVPHTTTLLERTTDDRVRVHDLAAETRRELSARSSRWAAVSPRGDLIANITDDALELWDAATGERLRDLDVGAGVVSLAFSPDGTRLATTYAGRPSAVRLWDTQTGALTDIVPIDLNNFIYLLSADNRLILTFGGSGTARLWDVVQRRSLGHLNRFAIGAAAERDGTVLVAGRGMPENQVHLMDMRTGAQRFQVGGRAYALSPDGRWLATSGGTAYRDGFYTTGSISYPAPEVWLWDTRTRARWVVWRGEQSVVRLAFSPDGRRLVLIDAEGVLRVVALG